MERTELQAALKDLLERQKKEDSDYAKAMHIMQVMRNNVVRTADDELKQKQMKASLRHKSVIMDIEAERQQLFADYKAEKGNK